NNFHNGLGNEIALNLSFFHINTDFGLSWSSLKTKTPHSVNRIYKGLKRGFYKIFIRHIGIIESGIGLSSLLKTRRGFSLNLLNNLLQELLLTFFQGVVFFRHEVFLCF